MRLLSNLHVKGKPAVLPDRAIRSQSHYFIYRPCIIPPIFTDSVFHSTLENCIHIRFIQQIRRLTQPIPFYIGSTKFDYYSLYISGLRGLATLHSCKVSTSECEVRFLSNNYWWMCLKKYLSFLVCRLTSRLNTRWQIEDGTPVYTICNHSGELTVILRANWFLQKLGKNWQ